MINTLAEKLTFSSCFMKKKNPSWLLSALFKNVLICSCLNPGYGICRFMQTLWFERKQLRLYALNRCLPTRGDPLVYVLLLCRRISSYLSCRHPENWGHPLFLHASSTTPLLAISDTAVIPIPKINEFDRTMA